MMPKATRKPDLTKVDPKIAPLVAIINRLGIATYASCEGHEDPNIVQSRCPYVTVCSTYPGARDSNMINLLEMIGLHNSGVRSSQGVGWVVALSGDQTFTLTPSQPHRPLSEYHEGIAALVEHLKAASRWYPKRKRRQAAKA